MKKSIQFYALELRVIATLLAAAALTAVVLIGLFMGPLKAYGNPSQLTGTASTALATTTLAYLNAGTATSTLVYDAYGTNGTNQTQNGNFDIPSRLSLNIQMTASSAPSSVLNIAIEHASGDGGLNCNATPTTCDWYQDNVLTQAGVSTTTAVTDISLPFTASWRFASSTLGGNGTIARDRNSKSITVPVTTRYTRAVITNTGSPAGVWAQFVPMKELSK